MSFSSGNPGPSIHDFENTPLRGGWSFTITVHLEGHAEAKDESMERPVKLHVILVNVIVEPSVAKAARNRISKLV